MTIGGVMEAHIVFAISVGLLILLWLGVAFVAIVRRCIKNGQWPIG